MPQSVSIDVLAEHLMERCDILASHTEEPGRITRRYGTEPLAEAMAIVEDWMRQAGLQTRRDAIGNLFGLLPGPVEDAPRLLMGGHLDTVRDAGRYDGILGVLSAIATVEAVQARVTQLPFALEVVAFAEEEGSRYLPYLGSLSAVGGLSREALETLDVDGISLRDAIAGWGFDPEGSLKGSLVEHRYLGFIEAHIEQGPRLEVAGLPVGIVSGIVGMQRAYLEVHGVAGHAGTLAMEGRRDALVATAEIILGVDEIGRAYADGRATVGEIAIEPGSSNVVPGKARISLDVRHPDESVVDEIYERIQARAASVAARRNVDVVWHPGQRVDAMVCDDALNGALAAAIEQAGFEPTELFSGAGHDAAALARIMPVTMLFTRCKDGISHNPAESITVEDAAVTIDVLVRFVEITAATHRQEVAA